MTVRTLQSTDTTATSGLALGRLPFRYQAAVLIAILGAGAAAAAIGLVDRLDRAAAAWALLLLVAVLSLLRPRLWLNLLASLAASVAFGALIAVQERTAGRGPADLISLPVFVSIAALWCMPLALRLLMCEPQRLLSQIRLQQQVIDGLARQDERTGAYRPQHLDAFLREEVERGRRSQRSFTICLVGIDRWSEFVADVGADEAAQRLRRAISSVAGSQRLLDKVVDLGDGELVLLLPETPLGGAETVAWRIQSQIADKISMPVRIGIAEFPRDAVTEQGLMDEVRQALDFARTANIPVVDRSLLGAD